MRNEEEVTPGGLTRRNFLKQSTAATFAASVGIHVAGQDSSAADRPVPPLVIGEGEHRYEVNHMWAKVPSGKAFGFTHGIVEDRNGRMFVANQSRDAIMIFDADGNFLDSWGEAYEKGAHGLTLNVEDGEEVLYLANTSLAEVVKTNLDGEVIWKAGIPPIKDVYSEEKKYSPTETAVAPNGNVYVADGYGQSMIHIYSNDGKYLHSFGGCGEEIHNLDQPHGIKIDLRGETPVVQVADRNHVRIVNFTLEGEYIGEVIPRSDLRFPCTTFHHQGLLYIPDLFARVSIFDQSNKKIIDLGDYVEGQELTSWDDFGKKYTDLTGYPNLPSEKRVAGKFISPHALWVNAKRDIFVVEWIKDGRLTKLTKV